MTYETLFDILDHEKDYNACSKVDEASVYFGDWQTTEAIQYIADLLEEEDIDTMMKWTDREAITNTDKAIKYLITYLLECAKAGQLRYFGLFQFNY